jgi:pimeloyl-ACP methyl ester carboxylesterase
VKLPAKVSVNDSRYGGPILLNPGGPGGSGIFMALSRAAAIQTITDSAKDPKDPTSLHKRGSEDSKYFDVIGFDPRGIGLSEPSATCMPDNPSWWAWGLREATEGIPGSSDAALGRLWSMSHAYGHACQQAMYEPDIKKYMTTVSVARDMLEIVEKHAEYVARQISRYNPGKGGVKSTANKAAKLYIPNTAKLQYWGFSYGTYLGSTFASMFPDRVGRVVLDGVVNTDDYSHALSEGSLYDNEKVMYSYYTYCQQAGPELCPLATVNATLQDIEGRVKAIVKSLLHHPLPLYTSYGPEILTYSDVKVIIFSSLYAPMVMFPIVSRLLEAISGRDEYYLYELGRALSSAHIYQCSLTTTTQQPDVPSMAVLCADSEDMRSEDLDTFERHWRKMDELSPTSGSIWSMLGMRCASWKIRALHRHRGAFEAKTSHPILWIANTADPVTPLKSARIMSERFPGSKLLIQDSAGVSCFPFRRLP